LQHSMDRFASSCSAGESVSRAKAGSPPVDSTASRNSCSLLPNAA
jgi:hypothetical protein